MANDFNKLSTKKDQIKMLNKELKSIGKRITSKDRKDCIEKLGVSKATISIYVRGGVKDIDKAISMLVFFTNCIENRTNIKLPK